MSKKLDEAVFDNRIVNRSISRGQLDPKEYEAFLKSLPDESKNAGTIKVFEEENVLTFSSNDSK